MIARDLPDPPSGYVAHRYAVGVDGRVSALFSTIALPDAPPPWPRIPSDAQSMVAVLDPNYWRPIATFTCRDYWYLWDVAPDDWCVVAESRVLGNEANATAFVDQRAVTDFHIGDGVAHVQCDSKGGVWVSYFDEGIFGSGANLGANGLVRLDRTGEKLFAHPGYDIADCYALNVARDHVWTCYYTDFPIVSMTMNGERRQWDNPKIVGAHGIAARGDHVALIGGYEGNRDRIAVLQLKTDKAHSVVETTFGTVFPDLAEEARVIARGDCIYAVERNRFRTCTVADLIGF